MGKSLIGIIFVAALALASGVSASVQTADKKTVAGRDQTILGLAASMPELSTFVTAINAAGLADVFDNSGPLTVFAPSNDAFAALPAGQLAFLLKPENKAQLRDVIEYHEVPGYSLILPADINAFGGFIPTLEGRKVQTSNIRGNLFINTAKVTESNLIASNGIFHVIDAVLNPGKAPGMLESIVKRASATPELSTFVTALKAAPGLLNILSTKGPFTVFAPSNKAFAALPAGTLANLLKPEGFAGLVDLLSYHVVSGEYGADALTAKDMNFHNDPLVVSLQGGFISTGFTYGKLYIDTAEARVDPHLGCSNGVIYTIDQVLNPAVSTPRTVVDFAVATPILSTFVTALEAAGIDTLSGEEQFTVFAPSNKAFAELPEGVLANLLKPENKAQLVDLLTYHVVKGNREAAYLEDGQMIKTVEGKSVTVRTVASDSAPSYLGKAIFIDSAKVMFADNGAENGVVVIIDAVLMPGTAPTPAPTPTPTPTPAGKTIVELAAATPELSELFKAIKAAGLVDTLSAKGPFTVFAPTNNAFAALGQGFLTNLLKPENKAKLVDLLTYHVLPGEETSDHFICEAYPCIDIKTLEGKSLSVRRVGPGGTGLVINSARVVVADISASNGVVQIIDNLLEFPSFPQARRLRA